MATQELILIDTLCTHYQVEVSFFDALDTMGLIEIQVIEQTKYIPQDIISDLERMIRIHNELNVNIEGIDVVFNLLKKMETMQKELNTIKNRLNLYESDL
ncbi:chaperone modulator CbpM [Lutibacter flavus]|uniref:MerR HTH family regulatory protein n=1 Tax=Lutibacter flavus TaxID=691689 RepID=A0A238VDS5_9FLAO|nr:chaperone modulator CbpM [Lutibacter flavus]SNR32324.1 MerR HTH family regulatory protein [Lutibacter flavus]